MNRNLEKHQKYKTAYIPNDFYWGLGVEHETYLETSKLKQISLKELKENRGQERYSVNYYNIYTKECLNEALDGLFEEDQKILLPILINSHTFQKTDINGEHQTTYERIPKPNPKFNGKTLFEFIKEQNPDVFANDYEKSYLFDGDTIEFMTQRFYKANVHDVIDELTIVEKEFMRALNSLPREGILKKYGPLQIAQNNYPFATYLTNLNNNAMFNNGTLHINITLPTRLNEKCEVADFELFTKQHKNLARAIQWISPLIVAKYGAYDPLSESKTNGKKYAAGSQRVAVSRYIGLGTYDTDKMPIGKLLTAKKDTLEDIDWYNSFHTKTDYGFLNELGLDINFNKHFCHGLEFRILESLPMKDLYNILILIVHLADFSLNKELENPKKSELWHRITENCVHNGKGYLMDVSDQNELFQYFELLCIAKEPQPAVDVLELITEHLFKTYKNGTCVACMINGDDVLNPRIKTQLSSIPEISSSSDETPDETPIETIMETSLSIDDKNKTAEVKTAETTIAEVKTAEILVTQSKKTWCGCFNHLQVRSGA
jgi:hypothetical protein